MTEEKKHPAKSVTMGEWLERRLDRGDTPPHWGSIPSGWEGHQTERLKLWQGGKAIIDSEYFQGLQVEEQELTLDRERTL